MPSAAELLEEPSPVSEEFTSITPDLAPSATPAPRFFYGWLMLPLAMLLMVSTSPGQTFGITYFNAKFRAAFDLSQTHLSAIYLIATVIASLALPYIGGLIDRFGLRRSALVATTVMAAVCVWASQVQGILTLFLTFVLLRIVGPGTLALLAHNTLASWFDRRLGLASSMMQLSMAAAMAFLPAGILFLIGTFDWRGAYLVIAAILAGGLLPLLALVYRQSPTDVGQLPDGEQQLLTKNRPKLATLGMTVQQAMQHQAYWILLAATATWALIGTGLVFHLDAIFDSHGLAKIASTRAMTCMALGMATFQILGGLLADRLALRWILMASIGLIATSCAMLAQGSLTLLIPSFAVYGCGQGLMSILASTAWARYFGRAHLGKIRGTSLTAAIGGSSLGPLLMGISDDYLGSFAPALALFTALAIAIAIAGFWATPPAGNDE